MKRFFSVFFSGLLLFAAFVNAAPTGRIIGAVWDNATSTPLPSANVRIQGSFLGTSTDLEGKYQLRVAPGDYVLEVSYIGYEATEVAVKVQSNRTTTKDIRLVFEVIEGEEVTITAQREGQLAAINQQIKSNTIVNVVSKERIRELPDDNAAESVGRLPGVAIRRSGGEGQRVNIRGMSPKSNINPAWEVICIKLDLILTCWQFLRN